jgi:hypothetical protein
MLIQDLIRDITAELSVYGSSPSVTPNFCQGWKGWQNLAVDEVVNDSVILDWPINSSDEYRKSGLLESDYKLTIAFVGLSQLDYTPEEHLPIIERCRQTMQDFINLLSTYTVDGDRPIRDFTVTGTTEVINMFNVNLSGVVLSVSIIPFNIRGRC